MSRAGLLETLASVEYYDTIDNYQLTDETLLNTVKEMAPDWEYHRKDVWFNCVPITASTPYQGWKIHVSATAEQAVDVLRAVVPLLRNRGISFKFALDLAILSFMNGKSWGRQGAGKFITIYPHDEEQFKEIIEDLYQATKPYHGLYILSDRRYKDSKTIYYRYGGIQRTNTLNEKGEKVYLLKSPSGEEVPDRRLPIFHLPPWVKDPFVDDSNNGREEFNSSEIPLKDGRYIVKSVFGYSNSGGVYIATDTQTGRDVVIKEARPNVITAEDAISLLKKEHRILSKIAHLNIAPQPIDFFQDWEHYFLVEEQLIGSSFSSFSARNNITLFVHPDIERSQKYYQDFKTIFLQLAEIMRQLHEHQIVFGDLSSNNIIIMPETLEIKIIDFEGAYEAGVDKPVPLYTPGFAFIDQMKGQASVYESDYFALGATMHYFLAPINSMFVINPKVRHTYIDNVVKDIGFPPSVAQLISSLMDRELAKRPRPAEVVEILQREETLKPPHFESLGPEAASDFREYLKEITRYTYSAATYERKDRLFPAFASIFKTNPLSVAYGACGIAYALNKINGSVPEEVLDWIRNRNKNMRLYPPGLYLGLSGIAWAMLELGLKEEAEEVLLSTYEHPMLTKSFDIYYGLAGWGMTNLKFFLETGKELYLQKAIEAGDLLLLNSVEDEQDGLYWKDGAAINLGYAHGQSGIALFLLYLHLASGSARYLDIGIKAMNYDIAHGQPNLEKGLSWPRSVQGNGIIYPYLKYGSAGVGIALIRYYRLLRDDRYKETLDLIFEDTNRKYALYPGFFYGLAGLGEFNLDLYQLTNDDRYLEGAYKVATGISLCKIQKDQGMAFPGDGLIRICCDYGTGSAGIAHFLHRLVNNDKASFMLDELFTSTQSAS